MLQLLQEVWVRPCVSGSSEIDINYEAKIFKTSSIEIKEGDVITIDGSTGRIILGEVPTVKPEISGDFSKLNELGRWF